jgi:hypothetical protein
MMLTSEFEFYRPSTRAAQEQKYFYDDRTIVSAGPQGVIGSTGKFSF